MNLSFLCIALVGLIAHGPILLDRGLYGDGWWYDYVIRRREWNHLKKFFAQVGLNINYYMIRGLYQMGGWTLFRFLAVFSLIGHALVVNAIAENLPGIDPTIALFLALFTLLFPSDHSGIDVVVTLQYHFMRFLYLSGMAIIWAFPPTMELPLEWRIASSSFIFIGFHANSILPYHYGLVTTLALWHGGLEVEWWKEFSTRHGELFVLPLIFWVYKEAATPRHGDYQNYNRVRLKLKGLIFGVGSAFYYPYWKTSGRIIRENIRFPWVWMAGSFLFLGLTLAPWPTENIPQEKYFGLALSGVFLTVAASFAYAAVGLGHPMEGIGTRYNLLLPIPFSFLSIGTISSFVHFVFPERGDLLIWILSWGVILLVGHWIMIYGCYFYHSVKYQAFFQFLRKQPLESRAEWVGVEDCNPIPWVTTERHDLYWTAMIQGCWGKPAFAIQGSILNETRESLESRRRKTTLGDVIGPLPLTDARLNLKIFSSLDREVNLSGWEASIRGWKSAFMRFFNCPGYESWMESQIHVILEPGSETRPVVACNLK